MSASQQRKNRTEQRAGGDKKSAALSEEERKSRQFRTRSVIVIAVIAVLIIGALFVNSNYLYNRATAVSVGGTDYSAAQFDYFFRTAYNNFLSTYGDYASMFGLDTSTPLNEQESGFASEEGETWADYFKEQAETNMQQVTALYDEANKAGFSLSQDSLDDVEAQLDDIGNYASMYGYNKDGYLAMIYGKGMNEKLLREMLIRHVTASDYSSSISDSYSYTDQELADYYATVADQYDQISYYSYYFGVDDEKYASLAEEKRADAARADAETVAKAEDGEEFAQAVTKLVPGTTVSENTSAGSGLSSEYSQWLLSPDREEGETTVIDVDGGSYALMFTGRDDNQYRLANVRHILIQAEADEEGNFSDEALETAKARAEELLAQWQENPTEDNFAAMAEEYSEDSGSNTNGGLYENVTKGQMVDEFDAFCFAEGRKAGDVDIVYGTNGSYAGYHIIYYVGDGDTYANYLAENALSSEAFNTWLEEITAPYTVEEKYAFRYASLR